MTKFQSKETLDYYLTRFTALKIPTGTIEHALLYFKKYPENFVERNSSELQNAKLSHALAHKSSAGKGKWVTLADKKQEPKKEKIEIKTFENPYLKKVENKAEVTALASSKMLARLPANRTLLAVNFIQRYEDSFIYKVFGTMGKIRRVFSGELKKAKSNGTGRKLFYYVIVFKHESDFFRTFDFKMLQQKVHEKFVPEYMGLSEVEKERIFEEYMQSIRDDIDNTERPIFTKDGYMIAKNAIKKRNTIEGATYKEKDTGRNRKKKQKLKSDFYKFQLKAIEDKKGLRVENEEDEEIGELDEDQIDDTQYLKKRKMLLAMKFKKEVAKRLKMKKMTEAEE
jgi:hypothetical protein